MVIPAVNVTLYTTATFLILAFIFIPFDEDSSGRYFVFLTVSAAFFTASLIKVLIDRYGQKALSLLAFVLLLNLWGTIQCDLRNPHSIALQFYEPTHIDHRYDTALMNFLYAHGEKRRYTNYWVSYPLTFQSQETLIFVPLLP